MNNTGFYILGWGLMLGKERFTHFGMYHWYVEVRMERNDCYTTRRYFWGQWRWKHGKQ